MAKRSIPEHFMHTVWQGQKAFLREDLRLADGSPVSVLDAGEFNDHRGGPDFLNARIAIDGLALSGDIELHREAKNWSDHSHDADERYSRVVMHVLLEPSEDAKDHLHVPTLVLRENLAVTNETLWKQLFEKLYDRAPELKCFPHNLLLPIRHKRKVVERFGEARLDELTTRFFAKTSEEWEQKVYAALLDALGYSQNRKPFRELADILTPNVIRRVLTEFKDSDPALTMEALFFGTAGLLEQPSKELRSEVNEHLIDLQSRWSAVQPVISLALTLSVGDWAFFRIRPLNSPHRRLAAAAALATRLFTWGIDSLYAIVSQLIEQDGIDPFWETHTSFKSELAKPHSLFGKERAKAMLLNVVIPSLLARSSDRPQSDIREMRKIWGEDRTASSARYLDTIEQELLEGENIKTVRSEQGALYLQRNYCEQGRCAMCPIGTRLQDKGWKGIMPRNP
jgi:hypothetical protein